MNKLITSIALAAALCMGGAAMTAPAFAAGGHTPAACLDGTAPEGWKRAGGYCEIATRGAETTSLTSSSQCKYNEVPTEVTYPWGTKTVCVPA